MKAETKMESTTDQERCDIAAAFLKHQVIPDVTSVAPMQLLKVDYANGINVKIGEELTPTQVKLTPTVQWECEKNGIYLIIMTDPDAPSRKQPKFREWHHWLVANIPGNNIKLGETLTHYVGAGPPQGTGLHRYVFLVFKQQNKLTFKEPRIPNTSGEHRPNFNTQAFAKKYKLGQPIAGNFFQAQYDDSVPKLYKQLSGKK